MFQEMKKMKKVVAFLLILLLVFGVVPGPMGGTGVAYAAGPTATAPSGTGTEADPYLISSVGNLLWIQVNNTSSTGFSAKYFRQTADIDLTGLNWVPIGDSTNNFKGNYNGAGYKIDNLTINSTNSSAIFHVGLFGSTSGAKIENLALTNVYIDNSLAPSESIFYVGSLVGNASTSTIINNVYVTTSGAGIKNNSYSNSRTGGLVGSLFSETSIITNAYVVGQVSGGMAGGIIGSSNAAPSGGKVYNSFFVGTGAYIATGAGTTFTNCFTYTSSDTAPYTSTSSIYIGTTPWDFETIWNAPTTSPQSYPTLRTPGPDYIITNNASHSAVTASVNRFDVNSGTTNITTNAIWANAMAAIDTHNGTVTTSSIQLGTTTTPLAITSSVTGATGNYLISAIYSGDVLITKSGDIGMTVPEGAVVTFNGLSVNSANSQSYTPIQVSASGTLNIEEGTNIASTYYEDNTQLILNAGTLNVKGGIIKGNDNPNNNINYNKYAISNSGTVNISGGRVESLEATYGAAITNTGTVNVSGTGQVVGIAYGIEGTGGTINVSGGAITANGGSGMAINTNDGTINVSGGAITATGSSGGVAINTSSPEQVNISGGTVSASHTGGGAAIVLSGNGTSVSAIEISGGTIETKGTNVAMVELKGSGTTTITGGTLKGGKYAIDFGSNTAQTVTINSGATVSISAIGAVPFRIPAGSSSTSAIVTGSGTILSTTTNVAILVKGAAKDDASLKLNGKEIYRHNKADVVVQATSASSSGGVYSLNIATLNAPQVLATTFTAGNSFEGWYSDWARTATAISTSNSGLSLSSVTDKLYLKTTVLPDLTAITLSGGSLSPSFSSNTTSYAVSLGNNASSITVTPTVNESNATITVSNAGITVEKVTNTQGYSIPLNVGNNTITITVAGTPEKTYTLIVNRAASNNAGLASVASQTATTPGALAGTATSTAITWTIDVANNISSLGLSDIAVAQGATKYLYSDSGFTTEVTGSGVIELVAGASTDAYIKVTAQDGTTIRYYKVTINRAAASSSGSSSSSSSGGSTPTTPTTSQELTTVVVPGTETRTTEGGKSIVTVKVNNTELNSKIEDTIKKDPTGKNNLIQIPVADKTSDVAKIELTGDIVKKLEENTFDVSVKRGEVEYVIPAKELTISNIAKELGVTEQTLKDVKIEVQITKPDAETTKKYNEDAKAKGTELLFPPVSFEITAKTTKADGTTEDVELNSFSDYVERIVEIPAGVDSSKITTGIVFNQDRTFSHVPTEVFQKDGKWYAKINSLTNSDYSVIWNPMTVKSVENHWSKDAVNDMASRLVLFDSETFSPNKAITRADFAEYIVRALGLYRTGATHENKFKDVSATGDRTLAILIANEYGIVTGYPDGTFRSGALITREEAMSMYARAMKVAKLVGSEENRYQSYADYKQVGSWATPYVREVLSAHVFNGTTATTISPKSNLTYAEAAQAIRNLLVESELINE